MTDTGDESIHWHCSAGNDCAWSQEATHFTTIGGRHSDLNDQCYQRRSGELTHFTTIGGRHIDLKDQCNQCGIGGLSYTGTREFYWQRTAPIHTKAIFASADRGCQTCKLLRLGLLRCREAYSISDHDFEHPEINTCSAESGVELADGSRSWHHTISFTTGGFNAGDSRRIRFEFETHGSTAPRSSSLHIY